MLGGALVLNLEGIGAGSIQGNSGGGELELGLLDNDGLERPSRSAVRRRGGGGRRGAILPPAGARGRAGGRLARGSSLVCAVGFLAGRGPADSRTAAACEHNHEHECESPNRECALQWTVHSPQPHSSGVVGSAWVSVRGTRASPIMSVSLKSSARSIIPMLPEGQPYAQHYLGSAEDPHPLRLLHKPHPDPTGALEADHPQPRMPLRSKELYEPIPDREHREFLDKSPLPRGTLLLVLFLCLTSLLTSV